MSETNFIDFENVEHIEDPIKKSVSDMIEARKIDLDRPTQVVYRLVEQRISLQDDLFQIFVEPNDFSLLNFDRTEIKEIPGSLWPDERFGYVIDLSHRIEIGKR